MTPIKSQPKYRAIAEKIADDCIAVRIRLLNRTITSIYDDAFRSLGITTGQMNILVVVAKLGPVSPGGVTRRLNMEKSTVSRNVRRMTDHGWLKSKPGDSGHRQLLQVSAQGARLLEKSLPHWNKAQERATAILGQRGVQSIHRAADAVWAKQGRK